MSTHDYSLSNQSGASFRSDLNNCLAAILSNNSNASEPSTTVAYSIWADTNAGKLKIRNAANDGFVDLINLDGTIQRDVSLTGDLTLTDKIIHSGDTNTAIRFPADDTFTIETAGSERLRVDSSGFVVLGLTAGRAKLDLGNGSNFATSITRTADRYQLLLDASDTSNCFSNNIGFILNGGTTVVAAINSIEEGGNGATGLSFATSSNSSSDPVEALRITNAGRVGIGDSDPDALLHLKASSPRIHLEDTGTNAVFRINADSSAGNAGFDVDLNSAASTPALTFTIKGSELMRLHSNGNFSIGSTTASAMLHVQGDLFLENATPSITLSDSDATDRIAFIDGNSGNLVLHSDKNNNGSSSTLKLAVDNTARLTINENGMITFADSSQSPYNLTTVSAANAVITTLHALARSTSSRKYKTNITTLTDALADKILNCNPVSYNSLCDSDDKTKVHYGLIAEEVDKIDKSLCFYSNAETPEPEGVQYDRFIPALINLIKRQKTQIETLETKVAAIEAG